MKTNWFVSYIWHYFIKILLIRLSNTERGKDFVLLISLWKWCQNLSLTPSWSIQSEPVSTVRKAGSYLRISDFVMRGAPELRAGPRELLRAGLRSLARGAPELSERGSGAYREGLRSLVRGAPELFKNKMGLTPYRIFRL